MGTMASPMEYRAPPMRGPFSSSAEACPADLKRALDDARAAPISAETPSSADASALVAEKGPDM